MMPALFTAARDAGRPFDVVAGAAHPRPRRASAIPPGVRRSSWLVSRRHPDGAWRARSTVCDLLDRHGLVRKSRAHRRVSHPSKPSTATSAPNGLWCADFKGQFKTPATASYCYPLTVTDGDSRYLLGCPALSG